MRRFYLHREGKGQEGVSNQGKVLEGVLTENGRVLVEWLGTHPTISIYDSLEQFVAVHVQLPHKSEMIWIDE